jgi:hypothetical protein
LPEDESAMLDCYRGDLNNAKKFSKTQMEKILSYLVKNLNETTERQKMLEKKVEGLTLQNESFILQNQQIIQEVINKNDYTKKLETLLFFILEVIVPKQPYKANNSQSLGGGLIPSGSEFKPGKNNPDSRSTVYKAALDNLGENFLKNLMEKYLDYNTVSSKINDAKILTKLDLPIFSHRSNNLLGSAENECNNINMNNIQNLPNKFNMDDGSVRQHSPNPFHDDFTFTNGVFDTSPNINHIKTDPVDTIGYGLCKIPSDGNYNINSNILGNNMNNHLNLFKSGSFDFHDMFKSETYDEQQNKEHENPQPVLFDESYFSISSSDKK